MKNETKQNNMTFRINHKSNGLMHISQLVNHIKCKTKTKINNNCEFQKRFFLLSRHWIITRQFIFTSVFINRLEFESTKLTKKCMRAHSRAHLFVVDLLYGHHNWTMYVVIYIHRMIYVVVIDVMRCKLCDSCRNRKTKTNDGKKIGWN